MGDTMIKSDNELIAEFMQERTALESLPDNWKNIIRVTCGLRYDIPPYDTSWDWLMPCVAKIRLILQDNDLYFASQKIWNKVTLALATADIKAVYVTVLEWIKWYNQQTVTPKE